ncbi:MAG TPA: tetratricopeptide repeat protein [Pirellulales bacterium]|nr:tetratricopeptide repeat protein [Pirellulales bacterium]
MTAASPGPPDRAELDALVALSQREYRAGRFAEAAAACRKILALRPGIPEMHGNLGIVLAQQGELDQALAQFDQAIALRPNFAEVHNNAGHVLELQGKLDAAAARFEQAIALRPDYAEAHYNLGNVLLAQHKPELAAARFEIAIALRQDYAEAHNNLGSALLRQGKLDEAAARFGQAITLRPDYAEAHNNLGIILGQQGQLEPARAQFEQALALRPDYAEAQLGLSSCYLIAGDYERGWAAYEARLRLPGFVSLPNLPRWTGEPLVGRSLLLIAEQGLGDTIQFIRYARWIKERGARVVLACPAALGQVLKSCPGVDESFILRPGVAFPRCDFYLPLLSAPGMFRTTPATIPCDIPYLSADARLAEQWRDELAAVDGFKIGIVWQGSRDYLSDRWRSIPLECFAPLARLPGVRLLSLQKGSESQQIVAAGFPILDLSERLDEAAGPFMDTAAVIDNLDLVVAANTAIAHLAGALGAPVWVALSSAPDWRWLRGRDDSPWYPTMRIFHQTTLGRWDDVFERIANAVQHHRSKTA